MLSMIPKQLKLKQLKKKSAALDFESNKFLSTREFLK